MEESDAIKRLLEGDIEPREIEGDRKLYSMAERIYGQESLEEMGISAPEISSPEIVDEKNSPFEINLPDFQPMFDLVKNDKIDSKKGKRRRFVLFIGLSGFLGVLFNIIIGVGWALCNSGVADMKQICIEGNTKVVISRSFTWDSLHQVETWVQPLDYDSVDLILLLTFFMMSLIGLFFRKKLPVIDSVHPSDEGSIIS